MKTNVAHVKLTLYTYQEMTYVEMRCTQNRLSPLLRFVIAVCMPHMYFLLSTVVNVRGKPKSHDCCCSCVVYQMQAWSAAKLYSP